MRFTRYLLFVSISFFLLPTLVVANNQVWTDVAGGQLKAQKNATSPPASSPVYRALRADVSQLKTRLSAAPLERQAAVEALIDLPMPDGSMHTFIIEESPIMAAALAEKIPEFKTYRVRSAGNAGFSGRLDFVSTGFHAYLNTEKGVVFIDPEPGSISAYRSQYKSDMAKAGMAAGKSASFSCGVKADRQTYIIPPASLQKTVLARSSNELRSYRLAVAATREYSLEIAGGDIADTQATIVTAINRVNEIYQRDLAITLELVAENDLLISTDTIDFTNTDASIMIDQVEGFINARLTDGAAAYDIGHVFSSESSGLATLGGVCGEFKAQGVTGNTTLIGDAFYIDFVAHEIGHQFGAEHTFNGSSDSCSGVNRTASTAVEPGSGSTIMAYAGICGAENVQFKSDDTFHAKSIAQIHTFTHSGAGNTCGLLDSTVTNTAPEVTTGKNFTIPKQTPFALTGNATDIDATDTLTYQWDQMDTGLATNAFSYGTDLGSNPLFRSFPPSPSAVRNFPQISTLVSGIDDKAEKLPDQARTMNFRLTVRDQNMGVNEDDVQLTVASNAGPFRVLSPSPRAGLNVNEAQVIEWQTACTEQAPVNCANVDILLSTDSGENFTPLLEATPNDGVATVSFPDESSVTALIKVACSDNIFFDTNDGLFAMQTGGSGVVLTATGAGGTTANCEETTTTIITDSSSGGSLNPWSLLAFLPLLLIRRYLNSKNL